MSTSLSSKTKSVMKEEIPFSFGLITDIQYADREDGWNYKKTKKRYYRGALNCLKNAVNYWIESSSKHNYAFAVHLGDVIDGHNVISNQSMNALNKVQQEFHRFNSEIGPFYHCIGNHDLYNFSRHHLNAILFNADDDHPTYYDFIHPNQRYRFIVLDCYGYSILESIQGTSNDFEAQKLLEIMNPNKDKNSCDNMIGNDRRYVQYNGSIDMKQLKWFDNVLSDAQQNNQLIILFSHIPIHPHSTTADCLLWNYQEVLNIIKAYSCVVASFSGHSHENGYVKDEDGIHYVVLDSALECHPDQNSFVTVHVDKGYLFIEKSGTISTQILKIKDL